MKLAPHNCPEYCQYYQLKVTVKTTWFVMGVYRNEDNIAFERTPEGQNQILEFFVPDDCEQHFVDVAQCLQNKGYVLEIKKVPNRFIGSDNISL
ncbi:MAG: hypothetical protein H6679_01180 [Epsilonproteobacteria bacterium]|nr:hypothetical protein [Campylobacterota bacterium]